MKNKCQTQEQLLERFRPELERLDKMALNFVAVNNIRYFYRRLEEIEPEMTLEYFMEVEALTTALVISYGRLFSRTTGTTKLKRAAVPVDLRAIHDELIEYRHSRYAHHGNHDSISSGIDLEFDGERIVVNPQLHIDYRVGASAHWKPLLVWLSRHMLESFEQQLAQLTSKSGLEWSLNYDEPPEWVR